MEECEGLPSTGPDAENQLDPYQSDPYLNERDDWMYHVVE
jgi:hypothetical protein